MLHTDRLGLRFTLQRGFKVQVEFAIQHLFRLAERERWSKRQALGELSRRRLQSICRRYPVIEADSFRFARADRCHGAGTHRRGRSKYSRRAGAVGRQSA